MKFKVGDRVMFDVLRGLDRDTWNEFGYRETEPGRVVWVDKDDSYRPYRVKLDSIRGDDDGKWWARESELTLIAPEPRFKVGDRVRVKFSEPVWFFKPGDTGEITKIISVGYRYLVEFDDGEIGFCDDRHLEPLPEPEPEPAAKVRYAITYGGAWKEDDDSEVGYATLDAAVDGAKQAAVNGDMSVEVWKLVAIVNPPAEPEVIRIEE